MGAHLFPRSPGVSCLNPTVHPFVLPQRPQRVAWPGCTHPPARPQQIDHGLEHGEQDFVAGSSCQQRVEFDVSVDVALRPVDRLPHPVELEPHRCYVFRAGALRGETGDLDLQDLAYLQKLPQRLRLYAQEQTEGVTHGPWTATADHRAAAMLDADEAAGLEQVQSLPYDRPAHPKMRTQLTLGRKTLSRLQPARDHHLQQLVRRPEPGSSCLLGHIQTLSYQSGCLSNGVDLCRLTLYVRPFSSSALAAVLVPSSLLLREPITRPLMVCRGKTRR